MKCSPIPVTLLDKGDEIANIGLVDGVEKIGVFIVATVRGTVWTLGTGGGQIASRDVAWHQSEVAWVVSHRTD